MDPSRRLSLLAPVLTAQALASLGALAVVLAGGLDALLFLAPVDWGLGLLVSRDASLAIAALLYLAGTATFFAAAHKVREGRAGRWVFLAAVAGLSQLPAGAAVAAYGIHLARRADFHARVRDAPVLAGRGLHRLVAAWMLASAAGITLGALGVALLFGATAPLGLALVFLATAPQGVLLWVLDRRIQAGPELLPPMPALPEWSQES